VGPTGLRTGTWTRSAHGSVVLLDVPSGRSRVIHQPSDARPPWPPRTRSPGPDAPLTDRWTSLRAVTPAPRTSAGDRRARTAASPSPSVARIMASTPHAPEAHSRPPVHTATALTARCGGPGGARRQARVPADEPLRVESGGTSSSTGLLLDRRASSAPGTVPGGERSPRPYEPGRSALTSTRGEQMTQALAYAALTAAMTAGIG
jgi:hypothetical protein